MKRTLRRNMRILLGILVVILFSVMSIGVHDVEAKSKKKPRAEDDIGKDGKIYACYKKNNGQLRVVKNHNKCKKSEKTITFNNTPSYLTGQLACVTGMMTNPTENSADIMISNQKNIDVSNWSNVFNAIYVQENPYSEDPYPENLYWGLQCKDEWVNTGCSQSNDSSLPNEDRDIPQYDNGCFSGKEEIENVDIWTTCCKTVTDVNGYLNKQQVAFSATGEGHLSEDSEVLLSYNTTFTNEGGGWNGSQFTAPVDGLYFFYISFVRDTENNGTNNDVWIEIKKNGISYGVAWSREAAVDGSTGTYAVVIQMAEGDYVETFVNTELGRKRHLAYYSLTGYRL